EAPLEALGRDVVEGGTPSQCDGITEHEDADDAWRLDEVVVVVPQLMGIDLELDAHVGAGTVRNVLVPDAGNRTHGFQVLGIAPHLDVEIRPVGEQKAGESFEYRDCNQAGDQHEGNSRHEPREATARRGPGGAFAHHWVPRLRCHVPDWPGAIRKLLS